MRTVVLDGSWDGWRGAARALLAEGVPPERVLWREEDGTALLDGLWSAAGEAGPVAPAEPVRVPRKLLETLEEAACFRDPERWALFYRVLWRVARGERHLVRVASDPEVHRLLRMAKAVHREVHKMHAFVRFRTVDEGGEEPRYVAWFEPDHPVVERAAPFFARRFASMRWSVLTPDRCAHWDGERLEFTPGLPRSAAPRDDELEALWRTYYAHTFNPARLRTRAMRAEMPKRYWRNLPEAAIIPGLVHDAPARVRRMIDAASAGPPEGAAPAE